MAYRDRDRKIQFSDRLSADRVLEVDRARAEPDRGIIETIYSAIRANRVPLIPVTIIDARSFVAR